MRKTRFLEMESDTQSLARANENRQVARICSDELAFMLDFGKPSSSAPMLAVVWVECPRTATSEHSASAAEVPKAVVSLRNQSVELKSADLRAQLASASR